MPNPYPAFVPIGFYVVLVDIGTCVEITGQGETGLAFLDKRAKTGGFLV
jgi:hypothetical protein